MKTYQFKVLFVDGNVRTVVKFYRSATMGECHAGYMKIACDSDEAAIAIAQQAM